MTEIRIPDHALPFFGPSAGFDWGRAEWHALSLSGLNYGGVASFGGRAVVLTTDLDIDIDGPGGDKVTDPCWQAQTSLKTAAGVSCNSREFPGYVMAPALKQFGVRIGDFGFIAWRGKLCAFQIYDEGPTTKAGEGSIFLGRQAGIIPASYSDHRAANNAPNINDVAAVIFPGSAPGSGETVRNHALPVALIEPAARACLAHAIT